MRDGVLEDFDSNLDFPHIALSSPTQAHFSFADLKSLYESAQAVSHAHFKLLYSPGPFLSIPGYVIFA